MRKEIYKLTPEEQKIVELVAYLRQANKEDTGWNGKGTVSTNDPFEQNRNGFGAEFLFCRDNRR